MIESVMKNAMEDDDFEMKVRSTPFPMPAEIEGKYFTSLQMEKISDALGSVVFWPGQSLTINIIMSSTWIIINSFTVVSVMRERLSQRKHFQEYHGQSKAAYWLARFVHDLVFYLPIAIVASIMMHTYDA